MWRPGEGDARRTATGRRCYVRTRYPTSRYIRFTRRLCALKKPAAGVDCLSFSTKSRIQAQHALPAFAVVLGGFLVAGESGVAEFDGGSDTGLLRAARLQVVDRTRLEFPAHDCARDVR